jgi:hypothetical protein
MRKGEKKEKKKICFYSKNHLVWSSYAYHVSCTKAKCEAKKKKTKLEVLHIHEEFRQQASSRQTNEALNTFKSQYTLQNCPSTRNLEQNNRIEKKEKI